MNSGNIWLLVAGLALLSLGLFGTTYALVTDPDSAPRRAWAEHVARLERPLRRMFDRTRGRTIASAQLVTMAAALLASLFFRQPWLLALLPMVAFVPSFVIERRRLARVARIDKQVDAFVTTLASALRTTPSLGDALRSAQPIVSLPLREELELALKELRLGATTEQALLLMAHRVGSRHLDCALSTLIIGQRIGGNLPKVLETTAQSLREMARLEGIVRTRTAEGRMQLTVLAATPMLLALALDAVSPGYFAPLAGSLLGTALTLLAALFWLASLVFARRILAVDVR